MYETDIILRKSYRSVSYKIVEQIMKCSETVITYHDEGSFMVQGVMIDGVFKAFPTLPIASESCENLTKL